MRPLVRILPRREEERAVEPETRIEALEFFAARSGCSAPTNNMAGKVQVMNDFIVRKRDPLDFRRVDVAFDKGYAVAAADERAKPIDLHRRVVPGPDGHLLG